jgi:ABC-2 type transport system ATP-binding protein
VADAAALRERIGLAGQYAAVDEQPHRRGEPRDGRAAFTASAAGRRSSARRAARALLAADAATGPYEDLSGGMRRRWTTRPRSCAPAVLFLDDRPTGLDPRSRLDLWETIEELVAEGTTVLLTTQYLDEADRLGRTHRGRRPSAGSSPRAPSTSSRDASGGRAASRSAS